MEPCADRCSIVQTLVLEIARLRGLSEREIRVGLGLTPEYVEVRP